MALWHYDTLYVWPPATPGTTSNSATMYVWATDGDCHCPSTHWEVQIKKAKQILLCRPTFWRQAYENQIQVKFTPVEMRLQCEPLG